MDSTSKIIANIRKQAARLIVDEVLETGQARVYNVQACIDKVKNELGINLKDNGQGLLVLA